MAEQKNAAATVAAPAPAAPAKKEKPEGQLGRYQEIFPTREAAEKEAKERVKGPNRAFVASYGDKTVFVVAGNWDRAAGILMHQIGGKVEEIGKPARASKPVGVDGVMAAVQALPEADREKVLEALRNLAKAAPKK